MKMSEDEDTIHELVLAGHKDSVTSLACIDTKQQLLSVSHDRSTRIWCLIKNKQLANIETNIIKPKTVVVNPQLDSIFVGGLENGICVYDYETLQPKLNIGCGAPVLHLQTDKNGEKLLFITDINCELNLWDIRCQTTIHSMPRIHETTPTSCRFMPDERTVITTSTDGSAKCTDIRFMRVLLTLKDHQNAVSSSAIARNGHLLITTSWDKTALLYDIQTGEYRRSGPRKLTNGHIGSISCCDIQDDGKYFVTGGYDKNVILWDIEKRIPKLYLKRHSDWINDVKFAREQQWLITASRDRTIRLWDIGNIKNPLMDYFNGPVMSKSIMQCLMCEKKFIHSKQTKSKGRPKCGYCELEDSINTNI